MNWFLLKNSLLVGASAAVLAMVLGIAGALWVICLPRRWRGVVLGLAVIAAVLPPFLVTNCWLHFFGFTGIWKKWLPLNLFSLGGTIWVLSLLLWPIPLLAAWSAWQRLEPAQLESDMAVTGWALVRGLLLPLAQAALAQAGVLIFVLAINNFAVPSILQVKVSPAEMWIRFNTEFDTPGVLQLCWPLIILPLLLVAWFRRSGVPWPHRQVHAPAGLVRQQLGDVWFWTTGAITVLVCFLSVCLPLLQLLATTRTWTELPGAVAAGQDACWNSFLWSAVSATLVTVAGVTVRRQSERVRETPLWAWLRTTLMAVLWLPFLLPGVLIGIALIAVFNRPGLSFFYQSAGVVVLAFLVRYVGFGWTTLGQISKTADPGLSDVARLEGASRWQHFRFVQWPQLGKQIAAAWYVVFLLCLWDVESMIEVVPPGGETLALRIFNLLHYGHNAQVNALCLALLILALLPFLFWKAAATAWTGWCAVRSSNRSSFFILLVCLPLIPLFPACARRTANNVSLGSQIFSRVQILGHRGVGVGEFNKPRSVAVDKQDNVYVTDMTGRVQKFSSNGVFLLSWQMPQVDKGRPKGLCIDRNGEVIVNEPHYQRVNYFSPTGKLIVQWGVHGTNEGQFSFPRAIAVNSRNELYVTEYGLAERVQRFTAHGEKFLGSFGHAGTGPGEFNRAEGIFIDSHDLVYVADSCNHRIQIFTEDGKFLRAYGKPGRGKGELSYPYDICVDASGRQYVCEFGNSRIQVFDAHDQPIEIIGGPGADPGQFSNPWSLALDSTGDLYVTDLQNHRVQKLIATRPAAGSVAAGSWLIAGITLGGQTLPQPPGQGRPQTVNRGLWTVDCGLWTDN